MVTALDVVENMSEEGLVISANILHSLLDAIEQILEFNLVTTSFCFKHVPWILFQLFFTGFVVFYIQ